MTGPVEIDRELLCGWPLPTIASDSDKEARGRVLVMAGGAEVAGATLLTALASLRTGAGKLQIAAPRRLSVPLALALPEARVIACAETKAGELAPEAVGELGDSLARSDAVVVGPGMLDKLAAGELALRLAEAHAPGMVVDAAAMMGLAREPHRARHGAQVVTPHQGEMAALIGWEKSRVEADPLSAARQAAAAMQVVVVLKGAQSLIVSPDGAAWRHQGEAVGLATSGSGDVLAGIIAGLLARGASPVQAAVWGVHVHGQAGVRLSARIGRLGFLARELLDEIAPVLNGLETAGAA